MTSLDVLATILHLLLLGDLHYYNLGLGAVRWGGWAWALRGDLVDWFRLGAPFLSVKLRLASQYLERALVGESPAFIIGEALASRWWKVEVMGADSGVGVFASVAFGMDARQGAGCWGVDLGLVELHLGMGRQWFLAGIWYVSLLQDLCITSFHELMTSLSSIKLDRKTLGANGTARFVCTDIPQSNGACWVAACFCLSVLFDMALEELSSEGS